MDHNHPNTIKSYISRLIKFDVQAALLRQNSNTPLLRALGRMCLLADRGRPRKVGDSERDRIRGEALTQKLHHKRKRLQRRIKKTYGFVSGAEGTEEGKLYQRLTNKINSTMRTRERQVLKEMQTEYDKTAPVLEIDRQIRQDGLDPPSVHTEEQPEYALEERSRVVEALYFSSRAGRGLDAETRVKAVEALVALSHRRELPNRKVHSTRKPERRHCSKRPQGPLPIFQCPFCLADPSLSRQDSEHRYATKHSWWRHVDRGHLRGLGKWKEMLCPHPACTDKTIYGDDHLQHHVIHFHTVITGKAVAG